MLVAIRTISAFGAILFSIVFAATWIVPDEIESAARNYARVWVTDRVEAEIGHVEARPVAEGFVRLRDRLSTEKDRAVLALKQELPRRVAEVVARICEFDCVGKEKIEELTSRQLTGTVSRLDIALNNLNALIKWQYGKFVAKLLKELRIFSGITGLAFLAVLVAASVRLGQQRLLVLPASLLLVATVVSTGLYIFGQNWFYTVLFDNYVGYGYAVYIGGIFLLLIDIVYLGGQVTMAIVNGIASAISSCF